MAIKAPEKTWWKEAIVYQIYPASFLDSNGDGLGDLPGILSKMDYIKSLGVTAIWLSPIFKSPQNDMGYDISDYRTIHEPYETVEHVEQLINGLHERGIKLFLDLVTIRTINTPDSKNLVQAKPHQDATSISGEIRNMIRKEIANHPTIGHLLRHRVLLQKCIDGYRIDSMNLMSKHPDLPDAPITNPDSEFQSGAKYFASGPMMHEYIKEMRTQVFDKYDCMAVGELGFTKDEESVSKYVAKDRHELNMLFTGDIVDMDFGPNAKYEHGEFKLSTLRLLTKFWQEAMPKFGGWNSVYMDNHDSGRSLSRYASDLPEFRERAAKMLATYLGSLSGTLFLLQGQEIGTANVPREWGIEDYVDIEGRNDYEEIKKRRGEGADMSDVMWELKLKVRDNGRLPMQWDANENAGFSAGKPWMKVNTEFEDWNVERQICDKGSVLSYWNSMLDLRKKDKYVFIYGRFEMVPVEESGEDVFAYTMSDSTCQRKALVALNFSNKEQVFAAKWFEGWRKLIGENECAQISKKGFELKPYEGAIYCNWSS
ncbi:probable alpha-glucosidase (maltase) [Phialocephala subalpina]|uniref:Probable alpha-glucosidase (Maltase) n=1 Tax=Phialocephala subalpina TaxID=576137 RepID=A0A1L7WT69_9HELO|nr:probable alpha-glucosidase (maltase) [Phialocephala subalpina]